MANRRETVETVRDISLGLQNHRRWWLQPWNWKTLAPWKKSYDQPRKYMKKQKHYLANKGPSSQSYGFSISHVWMWELINHKEGWAPKHWCSLTVVLEKTLESPLDCKEIKPVNPKGDQPWTFIGMTDAKAEAPVLWPHDMKSWLTGKDPAARKDWGQQEKRAREDELVGWHHWLNGHECEQTLWDSKGQGSKGWWRCAAVNGDTERRDLATKQQQSSSKSGSLAVCYP